MVDTFLIGIYLVRITVLLAVIWVLHTKIGVYQEQLPSSENPKREIWEVLLLGTISFVMISLFAYLVYSVNIFDASDPRSPELTIIWAVFHTVPGLVIPLLFVLFVNKWSARDDLGFTTKIQSNPFGFTSF